MTLVKSLPSGDPEVIQTRRPACVNFKNHNFDTGRPVQHAIVPVNLFSLGDGSDAEMTEHVSKVKPIILQKGNEKLV
jgi:hypothetical protein